MLKPTKHLDPALSVLNMAAHSLAMLSRNRTMKYEDLYEKLERKFGDGVRPIFIRSVSFLFLLGKIEYHSKNDTFEYLHK